MKNCKYCKKKVKIFFEKHESNCKILFENKDEIVTKYKNGISGRDLSNEYKVIKNSMYLFLKNEKILRNLSDANKISRKRKPRKHSEETKNKLRKIRLKWMKENPEKTAWRKNQMSYPEKILWEKLQVIDKYIIEPEKSFYPYFADFTILNAKVVIEVDGSQHLLPHNVKKDKKKEDLIISKGYRVIRFKAIEVINEIEKVILKIKDFVNSENLIEKSEYEKIKSNFHLIEQEKREFKKKEKENIIKEKIDKLLNSNINFQKFGWVQRASKIINIKPQKVGKWMNKNMSEFYKKCFKKIN